MKKIFLIFFILFSIFILAFDFEAFEKDLWQAVSYADSTKLLSMLDQLKNMENENISQDQLFKIYYWIGVIYYEVGYWLPNEDERKPKYYDLAYEYFEKAEKIKENDAWLQYYMGATIGRKAQYAGIIKSLFMLGDYDKHINKAIELDPNFWLPYLAKGMRYRDVPWYVGGSYKKAEKYMKKALELNPKYLNTYLELGILYEYMKKFDEAKKMFEKVLQLPIYERYIAMSKRAKEEAKKHLESLRK